MPRFAVGEKIETSDPLIEVTITPETLLPVGAHRFQLVVTDDSGNASEPAIIEVIVRDTQRPTAIVDMANREGGIVEARTAEVGQTFFLTGRRSSDVAPGRIAGYVWTLLPRGQ